jgi:CRISPR-associated protein Cas1
MTTLYVTEPYSVVKKDGETLVIDVPENKERQTAARKIRVPLLKVDQVVVYGNSTITSPVIAALLQQHTEVCYLTSYGAFVGRLTPEFSKNGLLRLEQHRAHNDPARSLVLAKAFVTGKLSNLRALLMRTNRKREEAAIDRAAESIRGMIEQVAAVQSGGSPPPDPQHPQADTPQGRLLGLEGAASAAYFGVFDHLLLGEWNFAKRVRRPPTDPINALLSYAYTLLMHQVNAAVNIVGLDPFVGFLHSAQYGKPSLALDVMEEFRPIVADSVVLTLINNDMLKPDDFVAELGAVRMTDAARRLFLTKWEERLRTEVQHPVFKYKATYRRCLELQVRLVAKWLTGEIPEYVPFVVR